MIFFLYGINTAEKKLKGIQSVPMNVLAIGIS